MAIRSRVLWIFGALGLGACGGDVVITRADCDAMTSADADARESLPDSVTEAEISADSEADTASCDDLLDANDQQAQDWLDADLACETSADCTNIVGGPECTVACVVPIATAFAADFQAKMQALCQSYLAQGCPSHISTCFGIGTAVCVDGGCNGQ